MKRPNAIVTAIFGEAHRRIAAVSMPTILDYAHRIGASLIVMTDRQFPDRNPCWEKFRLAKLLPIYDRIAWIDADIIINPAAPSIFQAAPTDAFSAFDEGKIFVDRPDQLVLEAPFYGINLRRTRGWPHRYFNIGVMVLGPQHRGLLRQPDAVRPGSIMHEQTYLNLKLAQSRAKCHDLTSKWNGLHSIHKTSTERKELFFVHYAGWPKTADWVELVTAQMQKDLGNWK